MSLEPTVEFWSHPDMPYVETRRACQSRICYKAHSHSTFSIGAVDLGQSCFSSRFSPEQIIESGSLVVIPAHIEHSCNPLPYQAWSYQMMHLNANWVEKLLEELCMDSSRSVQSGHFPQLKPQIIKTAHIYQAFSQLNLYLFNSKVSILAKEQHLIEVLTDILLPSFIWKDLDLPQYYQKHLNELINYLNVENECISLEDLSSEMGISRYAIIRLFKNNFGLTPHAYQLNKKVNQARELLKNGEQIIKVAHDLGFTDQSHFNRVFKAHAGVTPKQYQRN
ncbi:AraC family transcriptional regulator [Acinetobacter sp. ANC 4648]|uniref:AraC family transcriptional regulator n=1 Tax=Acinetobacter sp. ANC 4648 TaxID=1977875 RepID=UPI000A34E75E|nr:helix-turn-helix domain-containing protein [Acinetobacter sp. ANC 4648]OTG82407.1 AraC family transcriptional regulator [Acinetobacter sp. ANC 4648]